MCLQNGRELLNPRNVYVLVAGTTSEKLVSTEASGKAAKIIALEWPWSPSDECEVWEKRDVVVYLESKNDPGVYSCPDDSTRLPIVHHRAAL